MPSRRAFTLIELLVVISILMVLGALLIPAVGWARTRARISQSRAILGDVEGAIEQFHGANGFYPLDDLDPAAGGDPVANNPPLRQALESIDADNFGATGARIKGGAIVDGWEEPLRYQHFIHYPDWSAVSAPPPRAGRNPDTYQLWSCGPDREDDGGGDDDLANW